MESLSFLLTEKLLKGTEIVDINGEWKTPFGGKILILT